MTTVKPVTPDASRADGRRTSKPLCEWCRDTATVAIWFAHAESPAHACDRHAALFWSF